MKPQYYIQNARIVNEGKVFSGGIIVQNGIIQKIIPESQSFEFSNDNYIIIDAQNRYIIPGIIDDQVHFRDPGLTHKADIYSESKAAIAGGITSYMEMPNTVPNTLTQELLEKKYEIASKKSLANYSFYMGASNSNVDEILKTDPKNVCGLKIFMGSSTGNMLVDNVNTLNEIFSKSKLLIAVHCEDENIIKGNIRDYKARYGEELPMHYHPLIRSNIACFKSSSLAVKIAKKYISRLHILHLSTANEANMLDNSVPLKDKLITAEVCVHHLWFNDQDYEKKGTLIKWNPAIKTEHDQKELFKAMLDDKIDIIATDHAPHLLNEKNRTYFKAPSGGPLVQHSLLAMLDFVHKGKLSIEKVVEKMCHAPAECFKVKNRGFIREGYAADLVIVDTNVETEVNSDSILYKCKWSPFEGHVFRSKITQTFVNGFLVFDNGNFDESVNGQRLSFER